MRALIFVGIGGGLGSIARYLLQIWTGKIFPVSFPVGTFLINITGCFLIGMFYALAAKHSGFTPEWRLFLVTGICGGFTTFSTYSYEGMTLLKQGAGLTFLLYVLGSVVLGLLATFAGVAVFK